MHPSVHCSTIYNKSSQGEGSGTPFQYSCLENPMDGGTWWAAVHGVMKSRTRLSDFTFTFHFHALEKEMATHSSVIAWRILGMAEPGGLPSMGSRRVGHNWSDLAADIFLELSCFFHDPADVGNLISGSFAFAKFSLNTWKFIVHVLLRPGLENFEHYLASVWNECNCVAVWTFFGIAFLWDWDENWPFPVLQPLLSFPNFLAFWVQHFYSIIF